MSTLNTALLGSWTQASGTIVSAISSTPFIILYEVQSENLNVIGNTLQATGNSLLADSIEEQNLEKLGNEIQALGNVTVIAGLTFPVNAIRKIKLNIKGNLLQALGSSMDFIYFYHESPKEFAHIYGNLLQAIGNSLQALAGGKELKGIESDRLQALGSWIQASGAVLSALRESQINKRTQAESP